MAVYVLHSTCFVGFSMHHDRPTFNTKGLSHENKAVSLVYHKAAQKVRISSILSSSILANEYITNKTFLARGHLTPDADFPFVSWQYTTYFFLNVCPQWQSINTGNWKRVENMVRKLAKELDDDLTVVTGTHDILELPNRYGVRKQLLLSQRGKKFPVPKYIWKFVYSERSKKGIALVVYNNPFDETPDVLCSSVCKSSGWFSVQWSNIGKGYVECCSYSQFKQFVWSLPPLPHINGILHGPESKYPTKMRHEH